MSDPRREAVVAGTAGGAAIVCRAGSCVVHADRKGTRGSHNSVVRSCLTGRSTGPEGSGTRGERTLAPCECALLNYLVRAPNKAQTGGRLRLKNPTSWYVNRTRNAGVQPGSLTAVWRVTRQGRASRSKFGPLLTVLTGRLVSGCLVRFAGFVERVMEGAVLCSNAGHVGVLLGVEAA